MYLSIMSINLITGYDLNRDECGETYERPSRVDTTPIANYLATYNRNVYYDVRNQ